MARADVFLNGGDDYGVVRGKRGAQHGVVIKKTKTAFVIGITAITWRRDKSARTSSSSGDYLASQGM